MLISRAVSFPPSFAQTFVDLRAAMHLDHVHAYTIEGEPDTPAVRRDRAHDLNCRAYYYLLNELTTRRATSSFVDGAVGGFLSPIWELFELLARDGLTSVPRTLTSWLEPPRLRDGVRGAITDDTLEARAERVALHTYVTRALVDFMPVFLAEITARQARDVERDETLAAEIAADYAAARAAILAALQASHPQIFGDVT